MSPEEKQPKRAPNWVSDEWNRLQSRLPQNLKATCTEWPQCLLQAAIEGIIASPWGLHDMTASHLNVLMIVVRPYWRHTDTEPSPRWNFSSGLQGPSCLSGMPQFVHLAGGGVSVLQHLPAPCKVLWESQGTTSRRLPPGRVTMLPKKPSPWSVANSSRLNSSLQSVSTSLVVSHLF